MRKFAVITVERFEIKSCRLVRSTCGKGRWIINRLAYSDLESRKCDGNELLRGASML